MELRGGVAVDMAIEAGDTETGLPALAIVGRIKFFLRKRSQQEPQTIELDRRQNVLEKPVVVIDRDNFSARHIAQLRPVAQKDRRRELRNERVGQIEIDIESFQPREHFDLHLREHLAAIGLQGMRQWRIGKDSRCLMLSGGHSGQLLPSDALCGSRAVGPTGKRLAPRHLCLGIELGLQIIPAFQQAR